MLHLTNVNRDERVLPILSQRTKRQEAEEVAETAEEMEADEQDEEEDVATGPSPQAFKKKQYLVGYLWLSLMGIVKNLLMSGFMQIGTTSLL